MDFEGKDYTSLQNVDLQPAGRGGGEFDVPLLYHVWAWYDDILG